MIDQILLILIFILGFVCGVFAMVAAYAFHVIKKQKQEREQKLNK